MSGTFNNEHFIELARKWPSAALQYLHNRFYRKLVHISHQRTNDMQASEDIVQTILLDVCRNIEDISNDSGFLIAPHLIMLVKYKSVTFYTRSTKTIHCPSEFFDEVISTHRSAEELLFEMDDSFRLRATVERLPQRERDCIKLKFFEGLSNDMVADRLGIRKKTVERHLTLGVRLLRKFFGVLS
ncbi:MAG: sigma-70 family RNA polymerase sigma factor [Chryseolinea sp.]